MVFLMSDKKRDAVRQEILWKEIAHHYLQDHPDQLWFDFFKISPLLIDEKGQFLLFAHKMPNSTKMDQR